jgi:hypothetical protein
MDTVVCYPQIRLRGDGVWHGLLPICAAWSALANNSSLNMDIAVGLDPGRVGELAGLSSRVTRHKPRESARHRVASQSASKVARYRQTRPYDHPDRFVLEHRLPVKFDRRMGLARESRRRNVADALCVAEVAIRDSFMRAETETPFPFRRATVGSSQARDFLRSGPTRRSMPGRTPA